nr:filamin/ABP280 repeat domain-containing protein [Rhodohalobacter sp. SW132]
MFFLFILCGVLSCDSGQSPFEDTIPKHRLSTTVIPAESGTIHPSDGEFEFNTGIEIEARPADGFIFDRWGGSLSGNSNPESLVLSQDRSVTAYFVERDYPLEIEIEGAGSITEEIIARADTSEVSDSLAVPATTVRLTAVPDDGWYFSRWEGDLTGSDNPETIFVDSEKRVSVIFEEGEPGDYIIDIDIEGNGTIQLDPEKSKYDEGEEVIITATAESGWRFTEWQGDLTGTSNSQTVEMFDDIEATALFSELEEPALSIRQQPSETTAGEEMFPAPSVVLTDEVGNPVEGTEVIVSLNKNSFSSESELSETTNSDGIAVFNQLILNTAASGYVLSFETDSDEISAISSRPFTIVAAEGDAANSSADVPDGSVTSPTEITITVLDRFENKVSGVSSDLAVSISGANNANAEITETENGIYTAFYTPMQTGTDEISVTLSGESISGSPFSSDVAAGPPDEMQVTQQPENTVAGDAISPAPSVLVTDEFENPVSGVSVSAELSGASFTSNSETTAETNSEGVARFESLIIHTAGNGYRIEFSAENLVQSSNSFNVTPAQPDLASSTATVPDGVAGSVTELRITLVDAFDNSVRGMSENLSIEITGANSRSLTPTESNDPVVYLAEYRPEQAGTDQIEILFNGDPVADSPYTSEISPADISPSVSTVTADPLALSPGEYSTVTIELRDEFDNPISGLGDSDFTVSLGEETNRSSIEETSSAGVYEFEFTSEITETVNVSISANGVNLEDEPEVEFHPPIPHEIIIEVQPQNSRSGEPIEGPPTVRVVDSSGDGIPDITVTVSTERGQSFDSGTLVVQTNSDGIAVFDDLVLVTTVRWFNLVFSVDEVNDVVSDRFRVSFRF